MIGLAQLGGPIACLGLALLLVAETRRERLAGLGFATFGACVLGAALAPHRPLDLLGGASPRSGSALGLARVFRRLPWLLPLLALACVPCAIGVHVGGASSKLLLPLYVVILGAAMLLALGSRRRATRASRELGPRPGRSPPYVALDGRVARLEQGRAARARSSCSRSTSRSRCSRSRSRACRGAARPARALRRGDGDGLVFAGVGFYQYETRDIFQNPKVINSNAYAPFFRVNSVFWDPSVYGRFLVVAMLPSLVLLVLGRSLALALVAAAALVVTWLGLLISFSQSSFAALLVVVIGAAFVAWRWRALVAVALAVAVLAGIAVAQPQIRRSLAAPHVERPEQRDERPLRASSRTGSGSPRAHPVLGVGVGGFKRAYADRVQAQGQGSEEGGVA